MIRRVWAEDDTKAGVLLIGYAVVMFVAASLNHEWSGAFNPVSFVALVVLDALAIIPGMAGGVMIGQGIKHAKQPVALSEPEDPPRRRPAFCDDCGKPFVESSANYGFDPNTGKPQTVQAQHCPDWSGPPDDPGSCGNRPTLNWTNPKPIIHQIHNHLPVEATKRQMDCPGCLWELSHNGTITREEADLLAQAFLN